MSGPRNLKAFKRAQALRAEILALLEAHPPLARPLAAKDIQARLSRRVSVRTVQGHVAAIRLEAELASLSDAETLRSAQFIP